MLSRSEQKYLEANAIGLAKLAVRLTREEIDIQGHNSSGRLIASIDEMVHSLFTGYGIDICGEDYGLILNEGVAPNKIPYTRGSGNRTSKYISGLIDYFKQKGLSEKEARGAAFGTAQKHKKEGLPTRASSRFSRNGKRKGFIEDAIKKLDVQGVKLLERETTKGLEIILFNRLNKITKSTAA